MNIVAIPSVADAAAAHYRATPVGGAILSNLD
jgi:hypothetical protein